MLRTTWLLIADGCWQGEGFRARERFCRPQCGGVSRLLVRQPRAFGELHAGKGCGEGGVFGAARIDADVDFIGALEKVRNAHLPEVRAVFRAFHAEIALAAAEPVVHAALCGRNVGGGPVGIAVIGDDAAQTLEAFVLVLDGGFQPVVAVLVDQHATLIETPLAVECRLHDERKEGLAGFDEQRVGIVVLKTVIGALPVIGMRLGDDADFVRPDVGLFGRVDPEKGGGGELHGADLGCCWLGSV